MAHLNVTLDGLRADDMNITPSAIIPGRIALRLAHGVWLEAGGIGSDIELDAAALDRLADLAHEAAATLRATAGSEDR